MAPMHFDKSTKDGLVTEELVKHYVDRASNLGLQIVEATTVSKNNRWHHFLNIDSDRFIPGLEKLVKRVHQAETLELKKIKKNNWIKSIRQLSQNWQKKKKWRFWDGFLLILFLQNRWCRGKPSLNTKQNQKSVRRVNRYGKKSLNPL